MKILIILLVTFSLVSCKKEHTCVCEVNRVFISQTYQEVDNFTTTESMAKMSDKRAKELCHNKTIVSYYDNFTTTDNMTCKLK